MGPGIRQPDQDPRNHRRARSRPVRRADQSVRWDGVVLRHRYRYPRQQWFAGESEPQPVDRFEQQRRHGKSVRRLGTVDSVSEQCLGHQQRLAGTAQPRVLLAGCGPGVVVCALQRARGHPGNSEYPGECRQRWRRNPALDRQHFAEAGASDHAWRAVGHQGLLVSGLPSDSRQRTSGRRLLGRGSRGQQIHLQLDGAQLLSGLYHTGDQSRCADSPQPQRASPVSHPRRRPLRQLGPIPLAGSQTAEHRRQRWPAGRFRLRQRRPDRQRHRARQDLDLHLYR
jgi:hypothetical protein